MKFIKALTLSLGEVEEPVISPYRLGLIIHNLYQTKKYKGNSISRLQKDFAESIEYNKYRNKLLDEGVLDNYRGIPAFSLLGRTRLDADEIICTIDPFCYISHLSAMAYHDLTDRIPNKIFLSTPQRKVWQIFATERMKKDLNDDYDLYTASGLPQLKRCEEKKIGKTELHRLSSLHLGAYKNVKHRHIRVATIGCTFLDMLKNPELCGGINHVLKVYDENAEKYLRLITDEIEQKGSKIVKVRAGYIIEERLGIKNKIVENWVQFAQRGGSRKLDASTEYVPVWSDKWCLSINVFENIKK